MAAKGLARTQDELERWLAAAEAEVTPWDPVALRPVIAAALREIHTALEGDDTARRDALRALFGPDPLRVYPDARRGSGRKGR